MMMLLTRLAPPRGLQYIVRLMHAASHGNPPCIVRLPTIVHKTVHTATPVTYTANPVPRMQHMCARGAVPKGMSVPAQMNRPMQMRQSPSCTNMLFNPYQCAGKALSWQERWRRFKLWTTSQMAVALCTRHLSGWSRASFKEQAAAIFTDINTHLAQRDMHNITPMVSDRMAALLRRQLTTQSREARQWRLAEPLNPKRDVLLVHGTPIVPGLNKMAAQMGYVQLTVCIKSKQQTKVQDAKGRVKKDWDDPPVEATDFWVFEHPLGPRKEARWRLVGMVNPYKEVKSTDPQGGVDPASFTKYLQPPGGAAAGVAAGVTSG